MRFSLKGPTSSSERDALVAPDPGPGLSPPAPRANPYKALSAVLLLVSLALGLGAFGDLLAPAPPIPAPFDQQRWGAARDLTQSVPFDQLDPDYWRIDRGEGVAIHGVGRAILRSTIGTGPWRVEGGVRSEGADGFGLTVEVDGRRAAGLVFRDFGGPLLASVDRFPPAGPVLSEALHAVPRGESLAFAVTVLDDRVRFESGGQVLSTIALDGPVTALTLYVDAETGGVCYRDLRLRLLPEPL